MYNSRIFLASHNLPSTASLVCYQGSSSWRDYNNEFPEETFVEISNCHSKVRLHSSHLETEEQYVEKIKKLISGLTDFVNYLEMKK